MQQLRDVMKPGNAPGLLHISLGLAFLGGAAVGRCDES